MIKKKNLPSYKRELKKCLGKLDTSKKELDKLIKPGVLRQIRIIFKVSLQELGEHMGVSKQYLSGIESGARPVSIKLLHKYIKFMDEELSK